MMGTHLEAKCAWTACAFLVLGCGGASGSSGGSNGGSGSSGQEVAGENEGFDDLGAGDGDPQVDHGSQSARELIGINPPPTPFESMSRTEQEYYMVGVVLPIHAEMFREYNAARYAQMDCATCHGEDGAQHEYEMPSRYLPPLPAPESPAWEQARARNPAAWTFMAEQVLPTIRIQLGEDDMTCFTCHPRAGG